MTTITNPKLTVAPAELELVLRQRMVTNRRRGLDTAWPNMNDYVSLKKGYPIFIAGAAGAGKTELCLDIMINAAQMHKWKWCILSPEMGTAEEILEQILEKVSCGYVLDNKDERRMPSAMFDKLMLWTNKHFRILDPLREWSEYNSETSLNMDNFFQAVKREEELLGGNFDGIVIDPFNELDIDLGGGKTMTTVKNELDRLLWWTKKRNYLTILTNHVNDKAEIKGQHGDRYFFWTPPAKKEEWAYGQQFARKGYQMLLVYEVNEVLQDKRACDDPSDYELVHSISNYYNMREILVQKTKPKGVGKCGKFRLFFDRRQQRYYSIDNLGVKHGIKLPKI